MATGELLTAKKISEKIGVSENKVKKFIIENNIEPDEKKGVCKYYGQSTIKKIEKALK